MAYLWPAGAESEQFGLVVGDQGSGPGTHARHISFQEPPGPQSPSLRGPGQKNIIYFLITVGTRSDEVTETSGM